jgi:hypothetical protein
MHCPSCGHEPPSGSPFCNGCGAKLVLTCASCGATPPPGSRFCNGCGATIGTAPAKPPLDRPPRDYTPKHLAEKILQSKSALEGERKQVTVLFADVKGSMELAEQLDPEQWHRILERFFEILTEGVHRFEGTVNQYTGDGIMALFGAPITHEDHAQRACYAALALRNTLRDFAREVKRQHGVRCTRRRPLRGLHRGAPPRREVLRGAREVARRDALRRVTGTSPVRTRCALETAAGTRASVAGAAQSHAPAARRTVPGSPSRRPTAARPDRSLDTVR